MKKNIALLALALTMTSLAAAAEPAPAVKDSAKKDGTVVATRAVATPPPPAAKADNSAAKGKVDSTVAKDSAKDPYAVPLFKDAKALGARWN